MRTIIRTLGTQICSLAEAVDYLIIMATLQNSELKVCMVDINAQKKVGRGKERKEKIVWM